MKNAVSALFVASLLFITGCGDETFVSFRTGAVPSVVTTAHPVTVLGSGYGAERGTVYLVPADWQGDLEDLPIEQTPRIDQWRNHKIVFLPFWLCQSGRLVVVRADGRILRGPQVDIEKLQYGQRSDLDRAYDAHIDQYAAENRAHDPRLDAGWVAWMKSGELGQYDNPRSRYKPVFQKHVLERKQITIAYQYNPRRGPYRVRQHLFVPSDGRVLRPEVQERLDEVEHTKLVRQMLEAAFPTYRFQVILGGNPDRVDVVVNANSSMNLTTVNWQGVPTIDVQTDVVLVHEMAHYLGVSHHYDEDENHIPIGAREGRRMPPGGVQRCTMDGQPGKWCNACLAGLGIPASEWNRNAEIHLFSQFERFHEHYER